MIDGEQLYAEFFPKVSAYVGGKVDNPHDAEDLVSQVFEKVYGTLNTFDETKASLSTWIYTVTRCSTVRNRTGFKKEHRCRVKPRPTGIIPAP